MELAIQKLAAISFLVIGLSHIVQPRAWVRYFMTLHGWGVTGNYLNAFLHLITGTLIVAFHDVWTWPAVVLTVLGWLFVLKAAIYFVFPAVGLKSIGRVNERMAPAFIGAGVLLVLVAGLLGYGVFFD